MTNATIRWIGAAIASPSGSWLTMWVVTAPSSTSTSPAAPTKRNRRLELTRHTAQTSSIVPTTNRNHDG
jgi:hypothetical protein